MAEYEKAFRHKTVKHFKVGPFIFKDSTLIIKSDSKAEFDKQLALFEQLWQGLHPSDKNAIRALKAVSNEEDVTEGVRKASLAVRGAVDTASIADRPAGDRLTGAGDVNAKALADGLPADPTGATASPKTLTSFKVGG